MNLRIERDGALACLTLARPRMRNALVPELLEELLAALAGLRDDASCRAVLLDADGPAFSIGGDMRRFRRERDGDLAVYAARLVGLLNETILALIDLPQPVVVAVQGVVTGGSLGLLLAADLVYLAPAAAIKAHYATAGFGPDGGWTALAPRLIGRRRAAAALLTNRTLRADEAVAWGLANEIVAAGELAAAARAAAQKIARYPAGTMHAAKRQLWSDRAAIAAALEAECARFCALVVRPEALAGVDAFLRDFADYPQDIEPTPKASLHSVLPSRGEKTRDGPSFS